MKFTCKSHIVTLATAFFTTTLLNLALWRFVWQHTTVESALDAAFLISLPIFIFSIFTLLYSLLTWPYVAKFIIPILLVIAAVTNYAMFNLGIFMVLSS